MKKPLNILIVEDSPQDAELFILELRRAGFEPVWQIVLTEEDFRARLQPPPDIVLSDFALPQFSGLHALAILHESGLDIPFILISGTIGEDIAVAAMQQGASDYLIKDRLGRLGRAVEQALEQARVRAERKNASEALKLFRTLLDQSIDTIEVIDPATAQFLDVNEKGCAQAGYTREEYLALTVLDIDKSFTPESWASWVEKIRHSRLDSGEGQHRRKDGSVFPIEFNARWVELDRDYVVTVVRDITQRRKSEAHLKLLETCVSRLNDMILITEAEPQEEPGPRIQFVNDAFVRRTGYSREEVLGRSPRFLQGPKTSRAELERIRTLMLEWKPVRSELLNYSRTGEEYWIELDIVPVANGSGRFTHWVSVERDITERKHLEEQSLRAQRLESIGTLAGGIAHDLNNVLAPIIMSIELLKAKTTDADSQNLLSLIGTSAQRGAEMVQQVISFARGVEGKKVAVQLGQLLQDTARIVSETFTKNIQIHTDFPRELWTVQGDPTQLHQVLLNLCVNARDAMPGGGLLTLAAENRLLDAQYTGPSRQVKTGPYVVLRVEDNGTGMPSDIANKIFDPFFTTKDIGQGTGLGLSTTMAIVKSHGGSIRVETEPGAGTKFFIYLPASTGTPESALPPPIPVFARGGGELILVVDDEMPIREITRHTLEEYGYRVLLASDGAEAVALFSAHREEIAAVITDIMMPVLDGPATIQILREIKPGLKIVAASGLSHDSQLDALGVHYFLAKPYTAETMLKTLQRCLTAESAA